MQRISIIVQLLMFACFFKVNAQTYQKEINKVKNNPKLITIDIYNEKMQDDTFKAKKHSRFILKLNNIKIIKQTVYDTVGSGIPIDYKFEYFYVGSNLKVKKKKSLDNNLKQQTYFTFKKGSLIEEILNDASGNFLASKLYDYVKCKQSFISELTPEKQKKAKCKVETYKNKYLYYKTIDVEIENKNYKKIKFKNNSESVIHNWITYIYNDKNEIIEEKRHTTSGSNYSTFYKYNDFGEIIYKKTHFSEFFYKYIYDNYGNWVEKTETTRVKSRRIITKRKFSY